MLNNRCINKQNVVKNSIAALIDLNQTFKSAINKNKRFQFGSNVRHRSSCAAVVGFILSGPRRAKVNDNNKSYFRLDQRSIKRFMRRNML